MKRPWLQSRSKYEEASQNQQQLDETTQLTSVDHLPPYTLCYSGTWKSLHMWNHGENCMGRRAFRESNKSMQPGLKHHGTHYVEVVFLDPWQGTFLLPNFPNPHQDECAQLCPTIFKILYPRMLNTMWTLIHTCTSSAQLPALSQISCFSAQKPRLAQKQQHKQQQQQQHQTIAKPFQNRSGLAKCQKILN